ncbi:MAG: AAA family ATPase, partial [Vulcanimicrobiaceae bacterium]
LLEAMQEGQVTIGQTTHALPDPFLVLATMNPLDSDGTYALPLAQLDRFIIKIEVGYPAMDEEITILERFAMQEVDVVDPVATMDDVRAWRIAARAIHLDDKLKRYIVELVTATRPEHALPALSDVHGFIECGASPRATLAIANVARARAFLDGRDFVLPDDVRAVAILALRHRVAFNHRIITENVPPASLLARLIGAVPAP